VIWPPFVVAALQVDEGFRGTPYKDQVGKVTIGYGRNLDANPLTPDEAAYLMQNDLARAAKGLDNALPFWRTLNDVRQGVLVNMTFNMGIQGLLGFPKMIACLKVGDFVGAAAEMRNSKWYGQVQASRSHRLADEMETGVSQ
jgi:lysozyme